MAVPTNSQEIRRAADAGRALDERVRAAITGALHEAFGCPCVSVATCARTGCQLRRRAHHARAITEAMSKHRVDAVRLEDV